ELMIEGDRADEAVALLDKHLATLKDKPSQVGLLLRLADLYQLHLKDGEAARANLEAAYKLDPTNAAVAFRLARMYAEEEQVENIDGMLELALCAQRPIGERVAFCESVSMLWEE